MMQGWLVSPGKIFTQKFYSELLLIYKANNLVEMYLKTTTDFIM